MVTFTVFFCAGVAIVAGFATLTSLLRFVREVSRDLRRGSSV